MTAYSFRRLLAWQVQNMEQESCAEQLPRVVEHWRVEEHPHLIIINIETAAGTSGGKARSDIQSPSMGAWLGVNRIAN